MTRKAVIVVGLSFGDEGKGTITEAVTKREGAWLVVRYTGGPQAAHHVVRPDGTTHCFAQYGAGTFDGADTYLSPYMVVDPFALRREGLHLKSLGAVKDVIEGLHIDVACPVVTPLHAAMNKARETARECRHGSCGRGVGEVRAFGLAKPTWQLTIGDLNDEGETYRKLRAYVDHVADDWQALNASEFLTLPETLRTSGFEPTVKMAAELLAYAYVQWARQFRDAFTNRTTMMALADSLSEPIVFEGAQGVLLDEWHGFHPHTTWSTTTTQHAHDLLRGTEFETVVVGVVRSYTTRHGHGPLPTERISPALTFVPDAHNGDSAWQGMFRTGAFDVPLTKYAVAATGRVDVLAVTHVDRITPFWPICTGYEAPLQVTHLIPGQEAAKLAWQEAVGLTIKAPIQPRWAHAHSADAFVCLIEHEVGVPVGMLSHGPTYLDKTFTAAYTAESHRSTHDAGGSDDGSKRRTDEAGGADGHA